MSVMMRGRARTAWSAVSLGVLGSLLATANAGAAARKTAMFDVTAIHSGTNVQVTITSKVWVTPTQARADVKHPLQGEIRFLVTRGYLYQLDPATKRGVRGPLPPSFKKNGDNFLALISEFAFDASGALEGAKKVRIETVGGYRCDVYATSRTAEAAQESLTVWVPQKMEPKIPVKAVMQTKVSKPGASLQQSVDITLKNLKLNQSIPASVFAVPAGYKIVTGKPEPPKAPKAGK